MIKKLVVKNFSCVLISSKTLKIRNLFNDENFPIYGSWYLGLEMSSRVTDSTVQLTSKFTTHLVFSHVFFNFVRGTVLTRISHMSKEIACVVLLWSLDFIVSISHGSL